MFYIYYLENVDLNGRPVERTKEEYPYSYDPYVVWEDNYNKTNECIFSDRLVQWDYNKFNKCCKKIWNNDSQYFDDRLPKDIEKFLKLYLNKQIKLTAIMEACNCSNGFPYWIFYYKNG